MHPRMFELTMRPLFRFPICTVSTHICPKKLASVFLGCRRGENWPKVFLRLFIFNYSTGNHLRWFLWANGLKILPVPNHIMVITTWGIYLDVSNVCATRQSLSTPSRYGEHTGLFQIFISYCAHHFTFLSIDN